ncbi:MAG: DUF481 domain-containing protein, partial [Planctomycetes bacterium]|nr:DUF481 domain-containing protein [Planctomycetota bacterium]
DTNLKSITTLGASYDMYNTADMTLRFEAGLTYTIEDRDVATSESYAGVMAGMYYTRKLSETGNFALSMVANQSLDESWDFTLRNRARWNQVLWGTLRGALILEHDYDNSPTPGLKRNDLRLILLVGYTF